MTQPDDHADDDLAITLADVRKSFGRSAQRSDAIRGLSSSFRFGEITGLVGPDGAGKTTLLRLIAGLLLPDSGTVTVLGRQTSGRLDNIRAQIGYMPQRFGLYEELTVTENLQLFASLNQLSSMDFRAREADLLHFTGLSPFADRSAGKLSGGMKQKLGLACALLAQPRVLLLDEPSVGVDPISRRELWRLIQDLAGNKTAVIWSTAYLDEAEKCDRVVVLDQGQAIADDTPQKIVAGARTRSFLLPLERSTRRRRQRITLQDPNVLDATLRGDYLRVVLDADAARPDIDASGSVDETRLEDVVVALLRQKRDPSDNARAVPEKAVEPAAAPAGNVISIRDLSRRFGDFTAVDKVSFDVKRGEVFGLLGPNGAGKSTIFRILCGLLSSSDGTAEVGGIKLGEAPAAARQHLGYMAQRFSLYGDLSVRENLRFMAGSYGLNGRRFKERLAATCTEFGLLGSLDIAASHLSLGHRQRLSLAAAVLHQPAVLFLDEPTSGVDPLARRDFWNRIGRFVEAGMTVLITSHFMDEAENCDRLAIIDQGRILASGTPDTLRASAVTTTRPRPTLDDAFVAIVERARQGNEQAGRGAGQ